MKRIFDFILKSYENSGLEIQKRSKVLLIFLLITLLCGILLMIFEIVSGFPLTTYLPFLFGIPFSLVILIFLKSGNYNTASLLFISIFIIMNSIIVIADPYNIPFELYRYTFSMMFALITACLVAYKRWQVLLVIIIGNLGLIILFLYKSMNHAFPMDKITVTTFINTFVLYSLSGVFGFLVITIQKQLIAEAEANRDKAENALKESVRRLRITEIYTKHSIVESIEKGRDPTRVKPVRKNLAILFCDIMNFTSISEVIKAEDVVKLLNIYYRNMNNEINDCNGEIDKIVGDSIMAIFDEPDDSLSSAIAMKAALKKVAAENFTRFRIDNGIGIHYGAVILGNIGSENKKDNTVIGDVVNSASRLEDLTRIYGADIIISENLKNSLKKSYCIRELDEAVLKGKKNQELIFEVYDQKNDDEKTWIAKNQETYRAAYSHYKKAEFEKAAAIYKNLLKGSTFDNKLLNYYIERCLMLNNRKANGQLKNWRGIFKF
jgi:class 3 adenylate cyclase